MKKIISLYLITLFITSAIIAQADSSYISKFQADLVDNYATIAEFSKDNYFQILSKAAEYTFSDQNPNFQKALLEISGSQNITEEKAVEKLFEKTYAALRKDFLWNGASGISSQDKQMLSVYNESLCPCMTSKVPKGSLMEPVLKAQQACVAGLLTDTVFINELKRVAGGNTLNDLYRLQRYLFLLMYEKCELIYSKFNNTILGNSVFSGYEQSITQRRRLESMNVLILYENNKLDSLKLIFPSYAKYIPALKEAIKNKNLKKNEINTYYNGRVVNSKPRSVVEVRDKDGIGVQLTFTLSEHTLNSKITAAQIKPLEPYKGERIMEIREDVSIPKEKKN
jgi:hypothetical protein